MGWLTLGAWLSALQALLPPGAALTREPGAVLTSVLSAFAAMLLACQLRLTALLGEFDPRRATSMLGDWETLLALPDACNADAQLSDSSRQRLAFAKLTEAGGQSREYFVDLAARYGEADVTIHDAFTPMHCNSICTAALVSDADRFAWQLRLQHPAEDERAMTCNDACDDALRLYTPSLAICPLNERKPAHTNLVVFYQPTSDRVLERLAKFALVDSLVMDF